MTASAQRKDTESCLSTVQFRGGLYPMMLLRVGNPRDQGFFSGVMERIAQAPDFFRYAPVVLDLQDLRDAPPFNMAELVRRLRQHQLVPIGVTNGTDEQNRTAVNAGLSVLPEGREAPQARPLPLTAARPAETAVQPALAPAHDQPEVAAGEDARSVGERAGAGSLLVVQAVRSGRQIYAEGSDLIVLGPVSPGAELLADHHIHVYGTLRGRAHAGVKGDTLARIFCQCLDAELVSIAGNWLVREDMPEALIGKAVQVFFSDGRVCIEPLA
jgi:septum site-determining protein MinC